LIGQFGGAAGTLASLGDKGFAVQAALMRELKLGCPEITWHVARDSLAETVSLLGLITATLGKIAYDVMLLMMNEVGELAEPYSAGRGSSSTMPQKHNPIACEMILSCGRIVRQHVALMLDSGVQDLERATGPWQVEWHVVPQSFILTAAALGHARFLLDGLHVDAARMRSNLDLTGGLIVAEAVVMALAESIGRRSAYQLVHDGCRVARETGRALGEILAGNATVRSTLGEKRLADLLDVERYVGLAPLMVDRMVR
jgi:3-carboxy-cis,cis-muconate cycloisomerase